MGRIRAPQVVFRYAVKKASAAATGSADAAVSYKPMGGTTGSATVSSTKSVSQGEKRRPTRPLRRSTLSIEEMEAIMLGGRP
mmetsp:Transcript_18041/g.37449  ORF Transcript_18041/g.37449 Transcript_18041/m.37449 type:complete len:82 (+) Transcript_18041:68-313(+)